MEMRITWANFHELFFLPEVRAAVPEIGADLDRYAALLKSGRTDERRKVANQIMRSLGAEQIANIETQVGRIKLIAPDERIVIDDILSPIDLAGYFNSVPWTVRDVTLARDADNVYISLLR